MIILITGAPGSGKTLYCVDKLIQPILGTTVKGTDDDGNTVEYPRNIYTNINGLLLEHELIDADWLKNLHQNRVPGSYIVFDEVQRVWPNRVASSKKPDAVEYLETHRHDGIDIVILTQNPQLLDPAVRALVGRHLHMRRIGGIGAAVVYEWDACSNGLNYKAAFSKKPYTYSRRVFKLYKSSKIHTKQTRSVPFVFWFLLAAIAVSAWLYPRFYKRIEEAANPEISAVQPNKKDSAGASPDLSAYVYSQPDAKSLGPFEYMQTFNQRIEGLPFTAPRYDQIAQPKIAPYPAACIKSESMGCKCFTQQATPIKITRDTCERFVRDGVFLDFLDNRNDRAGSGARSQFPASVVNGISE